MRLPVPSRTGSADRRPLSQPSERHGVARPFPKRTLAQAIIAGLSIDLIAREVGYAHGAAGLDWDPGGLDVLGYSSGYLEGQRFGRSKGRGPWR